MNSHELFHLLTRGAKFGKKNEQSLEGVDASQKLALCEKDNVLKKSKNKNSKSDITQTTAVKEPATRKETRIKVIGKNVPPPISYFRELQSQFNVSERLLKNIEENKYTTPTSIQMRAIPVLLSGRSVMACAPTGSGKTVAFLTPIIHDLRAPQNVGFRALVLAPTRELAQQIYRECVRLTEKTALKVHSILKPNPDIHNSSSHANKKCDILISTPNRIRHLLQQSPPPLHLNSIQWLVIDEADRLLEKDKDNFKDQLDDIFKACTNNKKQLALFSATYTVPVAKWAIKNIKNLVRIYVGPQNAATETVKQKLVFVGSENGKLLAFRDLVRTSLTPPVLVFVQSKDRAKQLFDELLYDGINVDIIHADRSQQQRDKCVRAFREGKVWVLICTELMGRGIDFKGVNLVLNYDFPSSTIAYIHRIGRAGRAGRVGKAITFFTRDDVPRLKSIAHIIKNSGGEVPDFMLNIKKSRESDKKLKNYVPKREDISTRIKAATDDVETQENLVPKKRKNVSAQTERKPKKSKKISQRSKAD